MITKERLEELIEQGAVIYSEQHQEEINLIETRNWDFFKDGFAECDYKTDRCLIINLERIFETKEDAEEYAEFGNITRTERLKLPSWEEFNKVSTFTFKRKDGTDMEIAIWHNCPDDDCKTIKITRSYDWSACCFEKPLTRENYNEARRLCVKLFKG